MPLAIRIDLRILCSFASNYITKLVEDQPDAIETDADGFAKQFDHGSTIEPIIYILSGCIWSSPETIDVGRRGAG